VKIRDAGVVVSRCGPGHISTPVVCSTYSECFAAHTASALRVKAGRDSGYYLSWKCLRHNHGGLAFKGHLHIHVMRCEIIDFDEMTLCNYSCPSRDAFLGANPEPFAWFLSDFDKVVDI
jgi:hypothetical protein